MDEYGFRGLPQIHFAWLKYTTLWRIGHEHFHKDRTTCLMERGIMMHSIVPLVNCFKLVNTSNVTSGSSLTTINQLTKEVYCTQGQLLYATVLSKLPFPRSFNCV